MCITAVSWLSQDITAASHTASGWRIGLVGWFAPRLNTTSYTQLEQHGTILHATNHIYDVCDPRHLQAITSTLNGNYVPAQNLHETVLWWWWWRLIIVKLDVGTSSLHILRLWMEQKECLGTDIQVAVEPSKFHFLSEGFLVGEGYLGPKHPHSTSSDC